MNTENSTDQRTPGSLHPACSTAGTPFSKIVLCMFVANAAINACAVNIPAAVNALAACWFIWVGGEMLKMQRR